MRTVRHESRVNQFHSQSNSDSDTSFKYANIIVVLSIDVSNCVSCILLSVDDLRELKEKPPCRVEGITRGGKADAEGRMVGTIWW